MGKRRILLLCLPIFLLFSCNGELAVRKATLQTYAGGAAGSGKGRIYEVVIEKDGQYPVTIDSVWAGRKGLGRTAMWNLVDAVTREKLDGNTVESEISVFEVHANLHIPDPKHPDGSPVNEYAPAVSLPEDAVHALVIYYHIGNTEKNLVVTEMESLAPRLYP